tara:strand:+ start:368 stop:628 length:261 start_codon:yes stop_codon:yes gene_type:complete
MQEKRYAVRINWDINFPLEEEIKFASLRDAKTKFLTEIFRNDGYHVIYDLQESDFILWNNPDKNDHPSGIVYWDKSTQRWTKERTV